MEILDKRFKGIIDTIIEPLIGKNNDYIKWRMIEDAYHFKRDVLEFRKIQDKQLW